MQSDEVAAMIRLFCLPYAGGGTAPFYRWRSMMPANIELAPMALPGHDGRLNEPAYTNLRALADKLADEISDQAAQRPFALLGHSMGSLLAFEIARSLRQSKCRQPCVLILSACRPPHAIVARRMLHAAPDAELVATLQERYGGIPAAVLNQPDLLKMVLPALRADLQMIETYQCSDEPPLEVPMLVLGGTEDPAVSAGHLMEWRRYITQDISVRLLPGGHFFLFAGVPATRAPGGSKPEELTPALRIILERLQKCMAANQMSDE
jgi:medium-chain acyl-[acyl-carrier-protein] hydrolase